MNSQDEEHLCDCGRSFASSRGLKVHQYREHGEYSIEIGETMVQRICRRLNQYDYKDVDRELANRRNKGRLLTNRPTEHEIIDILARSPWSIPIGEAVDNVMRTRRTVYQYFESRGIEDED